MFKNNIEYLNQKQRKPLTLMNYTIKGLNKINKMNKLANNGRIHDDSANLLYCIGKK